MREALFRAAQLGEWHAVEESVGQRQSAELTHRVFERAWRPVNPPPDLAPVPSPVTLLWPYPRGSSDIIDRANCADRFIADRPHYRIVTEYSLNDPEIDLAGSGEDLLVFCPFDTVLQLLDRDLRIAGRPVTAVTSEMLIGHLARARLIASPVTRSAPATAPVVELGRTRVVNGTGIGLLKAAQLALFARLKPRLEELGGAVLDYQVAWDKAELLELAIARPARNRSVVLRPFAASQGTAVSFLDSRHGGPRRQAVEEAVSLMEDTMVRKYGQPDPYPVTLTPFIESRRFEGRQSEIRVFVVADPQKPGIRAIPGKVGVAQIPFDDRDDLDISNCLTNLHAPPDADALPGPRELPSSDPDVLAALRSDADELERLGRMATLLWSRALAEAPSARFAYGSVDFMLTPDGRAVPIEMNGANVGSHPSVHPLFLDAFGTAMTAALKAAGL